MQPTKSVTIVIVALILTGMCGYLLQPTHEMVSKTTYDYKGDLTPSVIYSQIDDWTEYNPLTNVTGWTPVDYIPINEDSAGNPVANQYLLTPTFYDYVISSVSPNSSAISQYEGHLERVANTYNFGSLFTQNEVVIKLPNEQTFYVKAASSYSNLWLQTNWNAVMWIQSEGIYAKATLNEGGIWEADTRHYVSDLNNLGVTYTVPVGSGYTAPSLTTYVPQYSDPQYANPTKFVSISHGTGTWSNGQVNGVVRMLCTPNTVFEISEGNSISCPSGLPYDYLLCTLDFLNGQFYCQGVDSLNNTLSYTVADYRYDMTIEGTMPSSVTAITVASVSQHIVSEYPNFSLSISSYGATATTVQVHYQYHASATEQSPTYIDGTWYLDDGNVHTITVTIEGSGDVLQFRYYITRNSDNPNQYTIDIRDWDGSEEGDIEYHAVAEKGGERVTTEIRTAEVVKVFVDSTVVAVDPSGILWGNPKMPLDYFYPEQIQYDTRVLFNGFVKYGDAITVNGTTFAVDNGELLYPHTVIEGGTETLVTERLPLKGMAIDYIKDTGTAQFKVSLVFTEKGDYTIDLGNLDTTAIQFTYEVTVYDPDMGTTSVVTKTVDTNAGYLVSANGNWYWQAGLYSISTVLSDNVGLNLDSGIYGMSMAASCFMMMFFMILSTAVVYRFTEMEFCIMDWVILGCSTFVLLGLALI